MCKTLYLTQILAWNRKKCKFKKILATDRYAYVQTIQEEKKMEKDSRITTQQRNSLQGGPYPSYTTKVYKL